MLRFRPEHPVTSGAELEDLLSRPLDPEYEAWRAARKRYVLRDGIVVPLRTIGGGSYLTGSQSELIYSNPTVGTAKATFTSEAQINDTAGMGPQPILPPYFFEPSRARSQTLRVTARGIRSDVATTPTWQLFCRFNTSGGVITGPNVGSHAATQISATAATNLLWEFEEDIQLTIEGAAGANSTLRGLGFCTYQATTTTGLNLQIFAGGASPGTVATFDMSATTYLTISAACGTSSASNSIQLLQLLIQGLN
jgi:hypothetical protein